VEQETKLGLSLGWIFMVSRWVCTVKHTGFWGYVAIGWLHFLT